MAMALTMLPGCWAIFMPTFRSNHILPDPITQLILPSPGQPPLLDQTTLMRRLILKCRIYHFLENRRNILTVNGHAVFVMSGDISVSGNASINIASGASLKIYTQDDVDIGGNGIVNTDMVPRDVYIYGTAEETVNSSGLSVSAQSIKIHGNGQLASVVYAPNAGVTLNGGGTNGQVMGGVVAFTASVPVVVPSTLMKPCASR